MQTLIRSWLPMVRPLLRSIMVLDPAPLRNAVKLMRLRQEFGLIEVREVR